MRRRQLTAHGQRGDAVHPDIGHRTGYRLADVDEAVLHILLGEVLAGEVERVLALHHPLLGDVVQRGRWLQWGDIGA